MSPSSPAYVVFLLIVRGLSLALPPRSRWALLLFSSVGFYALIVGPELLAALGLVATISYWAGRLVRRAEQTGAASAWLWCSIVSLLAPLFCFRYLGVLRSALAGTGSTGVTTFEATVTGTVEAVGLSYYTFQALSYVADVHIGKIDPEEHFGFYCLYLGFFPKLLMGPIERAADLLPQLRQEFAFDYENTRSGLLLLTWGVFKKAVIADRLGILVSPVFSDVVEYHGLAVVLAVYGFAFQLYLDFSGYTDVALGSARLFNVRLTDNFASPYLSTSITEFWRGWHISFSRWLFDYVFVPVQLKLRTRPLLANVVALLVTFSVCGIWHGPAATFVVWGMINAVYMIAPILRKGGRTGGAARGAKKSRWVVAVQVVVTFHLTCLAWVFFRARSLGDAVQLLSNGFSGLWPPATWAGSVRDLVRLAMAPDLRRCVGILGVSLCAYSLVALSSMRGRTLRDLFSLPWTVRWAIYYVLILGIVCLGLFGESRFLYFQF